VATPVAGTPSYRQDIAATSIFFKVKKCDQVIMTAKAFTACKKDLERSDPFFKSLKLSEIWNSNGNVELTDVPLKDFFAGLEQRNFWTYMGSLTRPPCTEGVHWNIYEMVMPVSYD